MARAGGVKHSRAHEAAVQGLVSRAAAGDQSDFSGLEGFASDEFVLFARDDDVSMSSDKPIQAFFKKSVRRIQKLFHVSSPTS